MVRQGLCGFEQNWYMGMGRSPCFQREDGFNTLIQSYGGFMSSKVVEADAGIHSLAISVAVRVLSLYFAFVCG